ncbi:MAG: aldo/keto reductase, partial [Nocardioidaceae bacterium]
RGFDASHGIVTEAWGPLARGGELLGDKLITSLADKYGKTPAQVVIRWHLELGNLVIPKSVTPSRIRDNFDVFDFELSEDDVTAIGELNRDERTGPDPDTLG